MAKDFKLPKRARNPPYNWIEQKKKKRERQRMKRNKKRNQDPDINPEVNADSYGQPIFDK